MSRDAFLRDRHAPDDVWRGRRLARRAAAAGIGVRDGVGNVVDPAADIIFSGAAVYADPDDDQVALVELRTGIKSLFNNTGEDVPAYTVVVTDPTSDDAFMFAGAAQVSDRGIGVTQAPIAAGESGPVMFSGTTPVRVGATVTRGDFLETSASDGLADTNGSRREGTFGVLLEGADPTPVPDISAVLLDSKITAQDAGATSLTFDMPTTVPTGMALFLALWLDSGGSTPTIAGWTRIGATSGFRYYTRISDGTEPATYTVTWTGTSKAIATVLVLDQLDLAGLVAGFAYDSTSSAATTSGLADDAYFALAAVEAPATDEAGWTTLTNENLPGDATDVPTDLTWKALLVSNASGPINTEPAGWQAVGFDDSAWGSVRHSDWGRPAAGSALEIAPSAAGDSNMSGLLWIARKEFTLVADALADATLSWLVDIAGWVYLDGTLIASLPTPLVTNFNTLHNVSVPAAMLTTGTHCLAVKVQNDVGGIYWFQNPTTIKAWLHGGSASVAGALVAKGVTGTTATSPFSGASLAKDAIFALAFAQPPFLAITLPVALIDNLPDTAGGAAGLTIEDIGTAETDTTKRLAPDGTGGVDWVVEADAVGDAHRIDPEFLLPPWTKPTGSGQITLGADARIALTSANYEAFPVGCLARGVLHAWNSKSTDHTSFDGVVRYRQSLNGGQTWTAPTTIYAPGGGVRAGPTACKAIQGGRLLLFVRDTATGPTWTPKVMWSDDGGLSFTVPVGLGATGFDTPVDVDSIVEYEDGTLVAFLYGYHVSTDTHTSVGTIVSTDHGETWAAGVLIADGEADTRGYAEPRAAYLTSGNTVVLIRETIGLHTWRSVSPDKSSTWTAPADVLTMTGRPDFVEFYPGALAVFGRDLGAGEPSRYATSWDEGGTWTALAETDAGSTKFQLYAAPILLAWGIVAVVYGEEQSSTSADLFLRYFSDGVGVDVLGRFTGTSVTFAVPSIALGTAAAAGAAATVIRSDATIVAFDATVPVTQALGDSAATGAATVAARRDHAHGMPALSTATPLVESGAGATGTATLSSREDHVHPASASASGTAPLTASDGSGGWVLVFTPTGDCIMV